jgi:hypothetical protein
MQLLLIDVIESFFSEPSSFALLFFLVQIANQLFCPIVIFQLQADCSILAKDDSFDEFVQLNCPLSEYLCI